MKMKMKRVSDNPDDSDLFFRKCTADIMGILDERRKQFRELYKTEDDFCLPLSVLMTVLIAYFGSALEHSSLKEVEAEIKSFVGHLGHGWDALKRDLNLK